MARVIDVNLIGPYLTCRAVVPHMLRKATDDREYCVGGWQGRQSELRRTIVLESWPDRAHEVASKELATRGSW